MKLHEYLHNQYPGLIYCHLSNAAHDVFECREFRLAYFECKSYINIDYIRLTIQSEPTGDAVVVKVRDFCLLAKCELFITTPKSDYHRFWRRNGFTADWSEDSRWKYQPM